MHNHAQHMHNPYARRAGGTERLTALTGARGPWYRHPAEVGEGVGELLGWLKIEDNREAALALLTVVTALLGGGWFLYDRLFPSQRAARCSRLRSAVARVKCSRRARRDRGGGRRRRGGDRRLYRRAA